MSENQMVGCLNSTTDKNLSSLIVVLLFSTILMVWGIIIALSYPVFQQTRNLAPYAELQSLLPFFYILVGTYAFLAIYIFLRYRVSRWCIVFILLVGGLIIWYTPYLMAGFVKQTDTLWHMGMASNLPDILEGAEMPFYSYATSFPLSYFVGYSFTAITGTSVFLLAGLILPLVILIVTIVLFFELISRQYNMKIAAIATLIGIGLLHYVELHMSPHVIGTILLLVALLLLLKRKNILSMVIGFVLLPLTHTISFGLFSIFFVMMIFLSRERPIFQSKGKNFKLDIRKFSTRAKISVAILVCLAIIFGVLFTNIPAYIDLFFSRLSISNTGSFIVNNLFLTPWFKLLPSLLYLAFAFFLLWIMVTELRKRNLNKHNIIKFFFSFSFKTLIYFIYPTVCLAFTILVAAGGGASVLIERGLSIFLILTSAYIIAWLFGQTGANNFFKYIKKEWRSPGFIAIIVVLFLMYPVFSYPIDAYNSFPESDADGIWFLVNKIDTDYKSVEMYAPGQIDSFIASDREIDMGKDNYVIYDIVINRKADFFKFYLHDVENSHLYWEKYDNFNSSYSYMKIYDNPSFQIYLYNGK